MPDDDDTMRTIAAGMLEFSAALAPMREFGKGYRAQLIEDGWTPAAADRVSSEAMIEMLRKVMRS